MPNRSGSGPKKLAANIWPPRRLPDGLRLDQQLPGEYLAGCDRAHGRGRSLSPAQSEPAEVAEVAATHVATHVAAQVSAEVASASPVVAGILVARRDIATVGLCVCLGRGVRIVVEERLGDRAPDEARREGRHEPAAQPEAASTAPRPLDRAGLADLRPRRRPGERGGVVAADLARGDVLGPGLERRATLLRSESGERLLMGSLDVLRRRAGSM